VHDLVPLDPIGPRQQREILTRQQLGAPSAAGTARPAIGEAPVLRCRDAAACSLGLLAMTRRLRKLGDGEVAIERPDGPVVDALLGTSSEEAVMQSAPTTLHRTPDGGLTFGIDWASSDHACGGEHRNDDRHDGQQRRQLANASRNPAATAPNCRT